MFVFLQKEDKKLTKKQTVLFPKFCAKSGEQQNKAYVASVPNHKSRENIILIATSRLPNKKVMPTVFVGK